MLCINNVILFCLSHSTLSQLCSYCTTEQMTVLDSTACSVEVVSVMTRFVVQLVVPLAVHAKHETLYYNLNHNIILVLP